jgi:hypothetical protein
MNFCVAGEISEKKLTRRWGQVEKLLLPTAPEHERSVTSGKGAVRAGGGVFFGQKGKGCAGGDRFPVRGQRKYPHTEMGGAHREQPGNTLCNCKVH